MSLRCAVDFFIVGLVLNLASAITYAYPPPPGISNINKYAATGEKYWGAGTWEDIRGIVTLPRDTELEGYDARLGAVNLNGHRLTIGRGGINIYESIYSSEIYGNGSITSSSPNLNFSFRNSHHLQNGFNIAAEIADNGVSKVGVAISADTSGTYRHFDLVGSVSNSFTGDCYVSGNVRLQLYKTNGAVALLSNIIISNGGNLLLSDSNQISDSSTVKLDGRSRRSELFFSGYRVSNITEKIHRLNVAGSGVLDYYFHLDRQHPHGQHYLYLDDLEIEWGGKLTIRNWALSRDYLLVRKDSEHLNDALSRIKFEGYREWRAGLKDFDKDYWQIIPAFPEPATYGAIFAGGAVWLVFWRKRLRSVSI